MIKRELYMRRIRPFINTDLIKVMAGMRRCGKSVMLKLIQAELLENGVNSEQFICINFEDMRYSYLLTAESLHNEITKKAADIVGKVYLFLMKFRKSKTGRNASIHFVLHWIAIYILLAPTQSFCLAS